MSRQVFVVWQLNFLCSLCRSYCIFWDDGWRFPMGSSGWPDRPSAVSSHLSLYQQYLLLLLLLCPGLQHLSVLPPPLGCWVIKIIIITKILLLFLPVPFSWLKKKSSFHLLRGNNLPKPTRTIFVKWWIQSLSSTQSSFIRCFTNPKEADRESGKQICGLKIKLLLADRSSSKVFPLNRVLDLVPFFPLSYRFCH